MDYFHAKEHLCEFANANFRDKAHAKNWIDTQSEVLISKGVSPIIKILEELEIANSMAKKHKQLLNSYKKNEKRMQYHTFKEKGMLIGSGAIESAHKDVLQERLKLSGQRWTMHGLQQMAELRVVHKSGNWNRIVKLCQNAA